MRLNRGYLLLGTIVVLVLGMMFGIAQHERVGFTPLKVGDPKQQPTHRTHPASSDISESAAEQTEAFDVAGSASSGNIVERAGVGDTTTITTLQVQADEAISEARYEQAAKQLQQIVSLDGGASDPRVHFKLAVCREALGDDLAALKNYEAAINSTHSQPLQAGAKLGRCRIWDQNGKSEAARNELYAMAIEHRKTHSERVSARIFQQLALSATQELLLHDAATTVLSDRHIYLAREEVAVEEIISEIVRSASRQQSSRTSSEIVRNVLKLDDAAESIMLEVNPAQVTTHALIGKLCEVAGLELKLSAETAELLKLKTESISIQAIPLAIVLDALLVPMKLSWSQNGRVIQVDEATQISVEEKGRRAERLLKFAVSNAPEHALSAHCYLALATLKHTNRDYVGALNAYESTLRLYPATPFLSEIWMNIGKCQLRLNRSNALLSFHKAIDLGIGSDVDAAAFAYVGRVHIENNEPQKSLVPLDKAAEMTSDSSMLADILLLQASAQLLCGQINECSRSLSRCAEHLQSVRARNQYSVLAMLLKVDADQGQPIRERDATALLSAISNLRTEELFGEHWQYLAAKAYFEIGLNAEVNNIQQRFLKDHSQLPLADRFREFNISQESDSLDPLPSTELLTAKSKPSQKTDAAQIVYLRKLLDNESLPSHNRILILKQLGSLYQRQGQHQLAVQCFTGGFPASE